MAYTLNRNERLRGRNAFRRVFRSGRQTSCRGLKLLFRENETGITRCAFVCSKALGNAVQRNREKRVARETYRLRKNRIEAGYDLVFILFPGGRGTRDRAEQFDRLLRDASLIKQT